MHARSDTRAGERHGSLAAADGADTVGYCTVQSATRREVVVLCPACAQAPASARGLSRRRPRQPARNFRCIDIAQKAIMARLVRRGGAVGIKGSGHVGFTQHQHPGRRRPGVAGSAGCWLLRGTTSVWHGDGSVRQWERSGDQPPAAGAQSSGMAASVVSTASVMRRARTRWSARLAAAPRHHQRQALLSKL